MKESTGHSHDFCDHARSEKCNLEKNFRQSKFRREGIREKKGRRRRSRGGAEEAKMK